MIRILFSDIKIDITKRILLMSINIYKEPALAIIV